jgi:hypothetical protein
MYLDSRSTFSSPVDVTLQELARETLFPLDDFTMQAVQALNLWRSTTTRTVQLPQSYFAVSVLGATNRHARSMRSGNAEGSTAEKRTRIQG